MPYGYNGKILHVDLSNLSFEIEKPPEQFYRDYVGGSALAIYYMLDSSLKCNRDYLRIPQES